jgi:hypothetical protein
VRRRACLVAVAATLGGPAAAAASVTTFPLDAQEQSYVVPAGVTSVAVSAVGGQGRVGGLEVGPAAAVGAVLPVVPAETLYAEVAGSDAFDESGGTDGGMLPGAGGDATDVRTACEPAVSPGCTGSEAASLASRLMVAAGGGSGGAGPAGASGNGEDGSDGGGGTGGTGGTQLRAGDAGSGEPFGDGFGDGLNGQRGTGGDGGSQTDGYPGAAVGAATSAVEAAAAAPPWVVRAGAVARVRAT